MVPLRVPSSAAVMCTTTRCFGLAPGSSVPSQSATIGGVSSATARYETTLGTSAIASPQQSANDEMRGVLILESLSAEGSLVDLVGIEPTTSSMPWKRAPSCATGPRDSEGNYS